MCVRCVSCVAVPYSSLTVGCPRELLEGERRVALTPANCTELLKKGFKQIFVGTSPCRAIDCMLFLHCKQKDKHMCAPLPGCVFMEHCAVTHREWSR
jgi:hypothetical protein